MPFEQFFSYIMGRSYIQWNDDDVCFVLVPTRLVGFYNATSPKQHSTSRHVAPLEHIILIPSQPFFSFSPFKYQFYSLWFDTAGLESIIYHA